MDKLKNILQKKIDRHRLRIQRLVESAGNRSLSPVTIRDILTGLHGVRALVTDISYLDPQEGIRLRGFLLADILKKLPRPPGREIPYVEGLYYLLLTGEFPTVSDVEMISGELWQRRPVPQYVFDFLRAQPRDSHPMTLLAGALLLMDRDSQVNVALNKNIPGDKLWEAYLEDSLTLQARLPELVAYIFRMKYRGDSFISPRAGLDYGANVAHLMGVGVPFDEVVRLLCILHSDHENGNVSAHTAHILASALKSPYVALSGLMKGLAGPRHGLANQEMVRWLINQLEAHSGEIPTLDDIARMATEMLEAGQIIPGFGHAVLRKHDPRFLAVREFCLSHLPDDPLFQFLERMYKIVPYILSEKSRIKFPQPNVDAITGLVLWHYGIKEFDFYTVFFGLGSCLGATANMVWARALGFPLEEPQFLSTDDLEKFAGLKEN